MVGVEALPDTQAEQSLPPQVKTGAALAGTAAITPAVRAPMDAAEAAIMRIFIPSFIVAFLLRSDGSAV